MREALEGPSSAASRRCERLPVPAAALRRVGPLVQVTAKLICATSYLADNLGECLTLPHNSRHAVSKPMTLMYTRIKDPGVHNAARRSWVRAVR